MAKIKKIDEKSLVHFNIQKLEDKINEFQSYLQINVINAAVTKNNEILLNIDAQDQLHKEILIQIKMQDALFNWVPLLEKLKQKEQESASIRGDAEIGGMFTKQL
jgi:hypothetical protein